MLWERIHLLIENPRVHRSAKRGYFLYLALALFGYVNALWVWDSYTWTPNGMIHRSDYLQFNDPRYLAPYAFPLLLLLLHRLKTERPKLYYLCLLVAGIFVLGWGFPWLLGAFGLVEAWAKYKETKLQLA